MKTYQNYVDILGGKVKRSNDPNLTILLPKTCRFCRFFEVLRLQRHLDGGKAQREGCCIWALGHKRGMEKKESDILWWSTKRRAKTTLSVKGSTLISPYWKLVSTWLDRDGTIVVRMMWFFVFWSKVFPFHLARSGIVVGSVSLFHVNDSVDGNM